MEHITLYYREGSSDKVYSASLLPQDGQFVVTFAYGRRGSTMTTGTKTQTPVPLADAKRIYDRLVKEKQAKGYTSGPDGTPYQNAPRGLQPCGPLPQLLNPVEDEQVPRLLADDDWVMQEKFDGRRTLMVCSGDGITAFNRRGLVVSLPKPVVEAVDWLPGHFTLDGESIGDAFHAFDLLSQNGKELRTQPYRTRLLKLTELMPADDSPLKLAGTAFGTGQKTALYERIHMRKGEGVVFKRLDAISTAGRPASGGPQLKLKFTTSASFVVASVNRKRSVSLALLDQGVPVPAGNVTIPPNADVPTKGDVVEVRYLYAYPESGNVYQPVFLGVRDDVPPEECTVGQLKFKPDAIPA